MIGQTFTLIGNPKLVFRLVWRGSIAGIDCVRGVALNGKFQTMRRAADVVLSRPPSRSRNRKTSRQPSRDPPTGAGKGWRTRRARRSRPSCLVHSVFGSRPR